MVGVDRAGNRHGVGRLASRPRSCSGRRISFPAWRPPWRIRCPERLGPYDSTGHGRRKRPGRLARWVRRLLEILRRSGLSTLRVGRRRSAILPTLVIVAVLVVMFAVFTSVWTDRLWYRSFDYGSVFTTMLATRVGLFAVFGLIMAAAVAGQRGHRLPAAPAAGHPEPVQPAAGALPRDAGVPLHLGDARRGAR